MDTYSLLLAALTERRCVSAMYQGHRRLFCPHTLGYKGHRRRVLVYQYGGESSRELGPPGSGANWRCMFIDQLSDVELLDDWLPWWTAPNHSQPQTCIDAIEEEVDQ